MSYLDYIAAIAVHFGVSVHLDEDGPEEGCEFLDRLCLFGGDRGLLWKINSVTCQIMLCLLVVTSSRRPSILRVQEGALPLFKSNAFSSSPLCDVWSAAVLETNIRSVRRVYGMVHGWNALIEQPLDCIYLGRFAQGFLNVQTLSHDGGVELLFEFGQFCV